MPKPLPQHVQLARCQLAVLCLGRALEYFDEHVFEGDIAMQKQLAKVLRWLSEVGDCICIPQRAKVSKLGIAHKLRQFDRLTHMKGMTAEQIAYRKISLLWLGLHLVCDAWVSCPAYATGGRWQWLCQSGQTFAAALETQFAGAWEKGTDWYLNDFAA